MTSQYDISTCQIKCHRWLHLRNPYWSRYSAFSGKFDKIVLGKHSILVLLFIYKSTVLVCERYLVIRRLSKKLGEPARRGMEGERDRVRARDSLDLR